MCAALVAERAEAPSVAQPAAPEPAVRAHGLNHYYGEGEARNQVLFGNSIEIPAGQLVVMTGPSGAGKTTLLTLIGALRSVHEGRIEVLGRDLSQLGGGELVEVRRDIGFIFQMHNLFDALSAYENVKMAAQLGDAAPGEMRQRCAGMLERLGLGHRIDHKPRFLSGGERQRVAIGRALVRKPEVFLFDEPLSNLDAKLRVQMRLELAKLHADLGTTMIYVTHDQTEAMTLADKIVVLDKGVISQVGSPLELYNAPANKFVAAFIGSPSMNFFPVDIAAINGRMASVMLPGGRTIEIAVATGASARSAELGVRPEHLTIVEPNDPAAVFAGAVAIIEHLGNSTIVYVETPVGQLIVEGEGDLEAKSGQTVGLRLNQSHARLFGATGATL